VRVAGLANQVKKTQVKNNTISVQGTNTANQCIVPVIHSYIPFCGNPTTYIIGCLFVVEC